MLLNLITYASIADIIIRSRCKHGSKGFVLSLLVQFLIDKSHDDINQSLAIPIILDVEINNAKYKYYLVYMKKSTSYVSI